MKTLAEILSENSEEIIRQDKEINRIIEASKQAGVIWPETEDEVNTYDDVELT